MKTTAAAFLLLLAGTYFCCCCGPGSLDFFAPPLPEPVPIAGGYHIFYNRATGFSVGWPLGEGYRPDIGGYVARLGWNSDFILAKRGPDPFADEQSVSWYIIDVANEKTYGPLSYDEFLRIQEELSVPEGIELLDIEAAWERAGGNIDEAR